MKEEKRDQFLVNMAEEISKDKKYIETPEFKKDNKKVEEVEINGKRFKLSYTYANTTNLKYCLKKGTEVATKDLNNGKLDLAGQGKESFETFKSYLKDIINLCYFDIELSEKHMDLIYPMVQNFLMEADKTITSTINECNGELNKLDDKFKKSDQHIKEMEMADYLNSPTYVTTNNVNGNVYGTATKIGKAPTGETNKYLQEWHFDDVYRTKHEFRDALHAKVLEVFEKFNKQIVNLLVLKADNLFASDDYNDSNIWLEYIKDSKEKELNNIFKCVSFYNIDLKNSIEEMVINNSVNGKETNKSYLDFYKLINDSKEIDVSSQLVDILSKNLSKKIQKMDDLSEKDDLILKETKKLDSIPHLKSDDKIVVINNLKKEINKCEKEFEEEELEYKKSKRKKMIKIVLIILAIALSIVIIIIFKEFFVEVLGAVISLGILYLILKFIKNLFF